jgi:hypothetical protein
MKTIARWVAALALLSWVSPAFAKDPPILSLTMEHFRDTATLKDDALDTTATITTEPGFIEHAGLLRVVWHDTFLRVFIDKRTGVKRFQVYEWMTYSGGWRFYETANFATSAGPVSVPATLISKDVDGCTNGYDYTEHVAFTVDEGLLRSLAAGYVSRRSGSTNSSQNRVRILRMVSRMLR